MRKILFILLSFISITSYAQCSGGSTTGTHNDCYLNTSQQANINRLNVDSILSGAKYYGSYYGTTIDQGYGGTGYTSFSTALTAHSIFPLPAGVTFPYTGTSAPTGYLLCDGSAVSRTTYADLFAVIGTAYVSGDGSTTFNLPDTRQRFILGKASSGTGSVLGDTGGLIDHLHTINPPSTTSSSDGSHNHTGVTGTPSATVQATILAGGAASTTHTHTISSDGAHTHNTDIIQFDSGTANPPFLTFNYIIKY